jgi:hypothetical protein
LVSIKVGPHNATPSLHYSGAPASVVLAIYHASSIMADIPDAFAAEGL